MYHHYYLNKIYEQGKQRIKNDFSLEKLLIEVREMKMCLETQNIISEELKNNIKFKDQIVIDLDLISDEDEQI